MAIYAPSREIVGLYERLLMENRMRQQIINVYPYAELGEAAQQSVHMDYRDRYLPTAVHAAVANVLAEAEAAGRYLGIDFDIRLEGEGKVPRPAFWFNGFEGPHCGAAFDGEWTRTKLDIISLQELAYCDAPLYNIARDLRDAPLSATAIAKSPKGGPTLDIDVDKAALDEAIDIERCLRNYAAWIYDRLKAAYLRVSSDEAIAAELIARGAEYTVTGGTLA